VAGIKPGAFSGFQILIDKVAIGNGKVSQYRFEFEQYPEFLQLLNSDIDFLSIIVEERNAYFPVSHMGANHNHSLFTVQILILYLPD